ncbi:MULTISPECIES: aspartate aminotransferase family protein [Alteribacter]|uniref:Aspartate aminotransferase family protein n=1 Tax=Alteribacter keqinensis TaxID=2483800 RepID=A0A3M7TXR5_9BACI|nr:aspartate aminotransferase family protein [Alteribacter keqinensis]MBM7094562.1 aspartate aminotransferase family protein [Alteribacter salitolerans]RNA69225.1 aspartate aminotransferase family protein [Alteribacter keqinensis]
MKESYLIKPLLDENYPVAAYGKGIYLYDSEGKEYIDGSSGAVTAGIGHGVLEIAAVMKEQAEKVSFVYRSQFSNEPAEKLAVKLKSWAPGDVNWTFFVNSGSEATETALKVALQYWQEKGKPTKTKVLSRWMSYHGITLGALSMSGHVGRRERFTPLLEDFPTLNPPYCYRCPFNRTYPECALHCAKELETAIRRIGADHIAAFIAEPIIGASGAAVVPPDGYYETISEICKRNDILFIADEVMTGIGRCGTRFAIDHWNVTPDIMALGKGLGAGYAPIAATMISDRVMEPIFKGSKLIMSGHTYSANPQSAAVALTVLNYIERHNLIEQSRNVGAYLKDQLKVLQQKYPMIGDVRGRGMLTGVEFVSNIFNKLPFASEIHVSRTIIERAMKKGLIVYPASAGVDGLGGDAVIIAPPLVTKKEEADKIVRLFDQTVKEVQDELQVGGFFSSVG